MKIYFIFGLGSLIMILLNSTLLSQSYSPPEFIDSKKEFLEQIFESDSCSISVGLISNRFFGKELKNNIIVFSLREEENSDSNDKEFYNTKFEKLYRLAQLKISNISNYDILKLIILKKEIVVFEMERKLE